MGCDAVATGHYVRTGTDARGTADAPQGRGPDKDQSYFLWDLTPEQLAAARFPVGAMTKVEVRAHARRAKLPTADKEESQEICFVPPGTRAGEFVARHASELGMSLPAGAGAIENAAGERIGEHAGHYRYTIGQRRGRQSGHADEADQSGHQQTARAAEHEPQQRAQDLPAVERVDRQHVEEQQAAVDVGDGRASASASGAERPAQRPAEPVEPDQDRHQRDVHERSGRDAPQGRAGPLRRIDVGDAAEGPQHDLVARPPTCRHASAWPNSCSVTMTNSARYSQTFQTRRA